MQRKEQAMGLFYSPKTLLEILKISDNDLKNEEIYSSKWYLSKEGEKAYENAKTPAQKTLFFFNYLSRLYEEGTYFSKEMDSYKRKTYDLINKVAFVLANFVADTSLPFSKYPDILDPKTNCFSNIYTINLSARNGNNYGIEILTELTKQKKSDLYDANKRPFKHLEFSEEDKLSDMYKLQRAVIGIFISPEKIFSDGIHYDAVNRTDWFMYSHINRKISLEQFMPPYLYNIMWSEDIKDERFSRHDEEIPNFEYDEEDDEFSFENALDELYDK